MLNKDLNKERKIFVYGSLMEGFFNYKKYLEGNILSKEKGIIKGKLYDMPLKGYPAVIKGTDVVHGELYALKDFNKNLEALDKMENYFGEGNHNNEYNRIVVSVTLESGEKEDAYMYFYNLKDSNDFENNAIYVSNGDWREHKNNLS